MEANNTNHSATSQTKNAKLVVEGGIEVLYKGVRVREIPFDREEITIGVMDPENDIYPDINLRPYRLDGGDPYISRKHARFLKEGEEFFIEDMCGNNSTSIGTKTNVLNKEKRALSFGEKIFISESICFIFQEGEAQNPIYEDMELEEEGVSTEGETLENVSSRTSNPEEAEATAVVNEDAGNPGEEFPFYLRVEEEIPLFFKPKNVFTSIMELNPHEWEQDSEDSLRCLQVGRRSTEDSIYPDIDLWKFYFNNGDEYIARRHARIFEQDGKLYFQDVSGKGSTWVNKKDFENRLLRTPEDEAKRELQENDRLIISDSVVFIVCRKES